MDKSKEASPAENKAPAPPQDDSLEAASEESVRFMEEGEAPGHAGTGDAG